MIKKMIPFIIITVINVVASILIARNTSKTRAIKEQIEWENKSPLEKMVMDSAKVTEEGMEFKMPLVYGRSGDGREEVDNQ